MLTFQFRDFEDTFEALSHLHGNYPTTPVVMHVGETNVTFMYWDQSDAFFSAHMLSVEQTGYEKDRWYELHLSSLQHVVSGLRSKIREKEKAKEQTRAFTSGRKKPKTPLPLNAVITLKIEQEANPQRKTLNFSVTEKLFVLTICQLTQQQAAIEAYIASFLSSEPEHILNFETAHLKELITQVGFAATTRPTSGPKELRSTQQLLLEAAGEKLTCRAMNEHIRAMKICALPPRCPTTFQLGMPSWTFAFFTWLEVNQVQVLSLKNRIVYRSPKFVVAASRLDLRVPLAEWVAVKGEGMRIIVDYETLFQQVAEAASAQKYGRKPRLIAEVLASSLRLAESDEKVEEAPRLPVFERSGTLRGPIQIEFNPLDLRQLLEKCTKGSIILELDEQAPTLLGIRQRLGGNGCKYQLRVRLLSPQREPEETPVVAEVKEAVQIKEDPRPQSALEQLAQIVRQRQLTGAN